MSLWEVVFILPLMGGIYIFVKTPLHTRYGAPNWIDLLSGISLTLITTIYFYFAHFSTELAPLTDIEPCGALSKQIECYNLSEETCRSAWTSSYGNCGDKLAEILKTRPSFLSGSYLDTCIGRNFDKSMHYNRRNKKTASCQLYFSKIDKKD